MRHERAGPRFWRGAAALSIALLASGRAEAEPDPDLPLHWTSPAAYPDRSSVMNSLSELMDVTSARWDRFRSIRGRLVALSSGGFELELVFEGPSSTRARRFRVRDCSDSADLAAAVLALALDPRSDGLGPGDASERDSGAPSSPLPLEPASAGEPVGTPEAPVSEGPPPESATRDRAPPDGSALFIGARAPQPAPASAAPGQSPPLEIDVGLGGVLDPSGWCTSACARCAGRFGAGSMSSSGRVRHEARRAHSRRAVAARPR